MYTLVKSNPLKRKFLIFWVLGSKFVKFVMSILNWQVKTSAIFASFSIVIMHGSHVNFKLIYFHLCAKGPHQSPNFEIFKCSGENLPNFSRHFWKSKPVFLQPLYQSWVPSNIILLYFLSSNVFILWSKAAHLKCKFLRFLSAPVKIC